MTKINVNRSPLQKIQQKYWQEKGNAKCGIQISTNLVYKYSRGGGILANLEGIQSRLLVLIKEDYLKAKTKIRGDI